MLHHDKNHFCRILIRTGLLLACGLFAVGCSKKEEAQETPVATETPSSPPAPSAPVAGTPASPQEVFTGEHAKVLKVIQGDTLKIQKGKKTLDVRLYGVVLPAKKPPIVSKAKKFASDLMLGKDVLVDGKGKDRSGRLLAMVSLPPGPNLNHELVREGYAQWDQKHAKDNYAKDLEDQARTSKRGMWAETQTKTKATAKTTKKKHH